MDLTTDQIQQNTELMVWNTYKQVIKTLKKIKEKEEKIQKRV